jgi:hypothetical protein
LVPEVTAIVVLALLTVCVGTELVLVLKLLSPLYSAVIECTATVRLLVAKAAEPPLRLFVDKGVAPSLKMTEPVGVPVPGELALTVAVNVTDWPETDGFVPETTEVELFALLTACEYAGEFVLPAKLLSPTYSAVIECVATLNELVARVATLPLKVPDPKVVAPSLNVTDPVAVPLPGAVTLNVAVNVTD